MGKNFSARSYDEYVSLIFNSSSVQHAIANMIDEKTKKTGGNASNHVYVVHKETHGIIKEMISNYKMSFLRMMAWFLNKIFK